MNSKLNKTSLVNATDCYKTDIMSNLKKKIKKNIIPDHV